MRHALDCSTGAGLTSCDCGITSVYRVLSTAPKTERTGDVTPTPEGLIRWQRVTDWPCVGYADSYEDARRRFGGRPVLELVRRS